MNSFFGVGNLLIWWSLNFYLSYSSDYAYLPNTMIGSAKDVLNGIFGVMPIFCGLAVYSSTILYSQFRFKDAFNAGFTMFYVSQGDTVFDTITGINQVSYFFTVVWSFLWIWFGCNIVMNVTLAQVEHGYLEMKNFNKNKWLT
jgi:hypothetical protein